jgi:hypothetical protein
VLVLPVPADLKSNKLPDDVTQALRAQDKVVLYSLEPCGAITARDEKLHDFKILGHTELAPKQAVIATGEFETAVSGWDGSLAYCFDPRHAIRVTSGNHTYDLLLCYRCHQLYLYKDDKFVVGLGATGSPKILNELLRAARVPLSASDGDPDRAGRGKQAASSPTR